VNNLYTSPLFVADPVILALYWGSKDWPLTININIDAGLLPIAANRGLITPFSISFPEPLIYTTTAGQVQVDYQNLSSNRSVVQLNVSDNNNAQLLGKQYEFGWS
jgi:hypothetical protein